MKALEEITQDITAGDPMSNRRWLRKSLRHVKRQLAKRGIKAAISTIRKYLRELRFSLRSAVKKLALNVHPQRNEQFEYITQQKQKFLAKGLPVISIDAKKKELIGNFHNRGKIWQREPLAVLDHDFPSAASYRLTPFGIYDLVHDHGFVFMGTSAETSTFVVDAITTWWELLGSVLYPDASELLILCDGGGANGSRRRGWKWELQRQLADRLGLTITVCHYPPGTSKWNPIEHRLFSFISLNWAGQPLLSLEVAWELIQATQTESGLTVTALIVLTKYPKKILISDEQFKSINLNPHDVLPKWNYTIKPHVLEVSEVV